MNPFVPPWSHYKARLVGPLDPTLRGQLALALREARRCRSSKLCGSAEVMLPAAVMRLVTLATALVWSGSSQQTWRPLQVALDGSDLLAAEPGATPEARCLARYARCRLPLGVRSTGS